MTELRVGLILDDAEQSFFVWDLFRRSKLSSRYSIEAVIVQRPPGSPRGGRLARLRGRVGRRGPARAVRDALFGVIARVETARLVRGAGASCPGLAGRYPLDGFDVPKVPVYPEVSRSGLVYRYRDEDLATIARLGLDVLVRGGSGILRGRILTVCPLGIVSFHHADNDLNRGMPPGFWEVYHREPATGFVVQRLLDELDGGDVLCKGSIPTKLTYKANEHALFLKSNVFLHNTLERIAQNRALPQIHPKIPYAYRLYSTPTVGQQLRYLVRTTGAVLRFRLDQRLGRTYQWGVAYQFVQDWRSAVLHRSTAIPNPPYRYLADPQVAIRDGRTVLYVEDYDMRTERGRICAYEVSRTGYRELGAALEEDFHLSFPFVFDVDGTLYMCPESFQANEIRLYRCTDFPLGWQLQQTLIKDVSATDTCIFRSKDRFWMLTNIDSSVTGEHCSELHVFHAESLDSSDWTPHPANPVVFDARRGRNAGLVIDGDQIYRVFQVQGFDRYGAAMGIARIAELDADTYREEFVCAIPPRFFPKIKGTHTFSFAGGGEGNTGSGVLAVDFARRRFRRG